MTTNFPIHKTLLSCADDLLAVIDGTTDQFAAETARLSAAITAFEKSIAADDPRATRSLANGEEAEAHGQVTNRTRAEWADAVLQLFMELTGCDLEDSLGDLLCDLMHWAGHYKVDFDLALERAREHFEAELLDEALIHVFDQV